MSYTVTILGNNTVDGEIAITALAQTSAEFHLPSSEKKGDGFISVDGRTCVGVAFETKNDNEIVEIESRLKSRPELADGGIMIRHVDLGPHKIAVANLLIPQTDFSFLADVFSGTKSGFWVLENTGWWPEYDEEISITPPGIVYTKDKSPLVIFRLGQVTLYFDESRKNSPFLPESYKGDERGYRFREKHPNLHISQVGDLLFSEEIEREGFEKGLPRLTTNEGTGLAHGYTLIYFDEIKNSLACAHLKHENTEGVWDRLHTVDNEGNRLFISGKVVTKNFLRHWPYQIDAPVNTLEGVSIVRLDSISQGKERMR